MATFVTSGHGDRAGYDATHQTVRDAAHAHDKHLRSMGIAGTPVQVRNHDAAGVQTVSGAFMSSPLPVAGLAIIEADT